jgi:VWFA-related protein
MFVFRRKPEAAGDLLPPFRIGSARRVSATVQRIAMLRAAILCGAALVPAQDPAEVALREGIARNIYITATDAAGTPATDLAATEVAVKEDGKSRDVLKVGPAADAMQVVLLVDDAGPGIPYIRTALAEFIHILQNRAEMAIVSTAGQNSVVVDFTGDSGALLAGVNRLTTRTTSGGYLLDAIQEAARTLQRREAARPVIVVLALEGKEFSNVSADRVYDAVRQSGAMVYALSIGKPTLKTMTSWNQRPTDSIHESLDETITRGTVLVEAPRRSGGRLEHVLEVTGIQARLAGVARELRDQLAVTYARPASAKDVRKIEVSIKRRGIKLRAPKHVS